MDRSATIAGGALGAAVILVVFALVVTPPPPVGVAPNLVASNGNGLGTVGQETPLYQKDRLSLVDIFAITEAGTVRVEVGRDSGLLDSDGVGSGFVFDDLGHIITNAHVIDDSQKIVVTFLNGRSYDAELVGADMYTDIAVIRAEQDGTPLHPLPLGDSSVLRVGEQIAAIGNPFGLSGSMTAGIVSQLGRLLPAQDGVYQIPDIIQTDAAINPGNSGGPLLNMRGEIVGINTAIQSRTGEFAGVGFAIPSQTIAKIVPVLIEDGVYHHPWLGISGRDVVPDIARILGLSESRGFLVVSVVEDSPAQKAGLHGSTMTEEVDGIMYPAGGDVIVAVDGIEVRKIDDILVHLQRQKSVGDEIVLEVIRDGRFTEFVLVLEKRPDA